MGQQRGWVQKLVYMMMTGAVVLAQNGQALAQASSVDPATRDMLIDKLSKVYLNIAPQDSSKVAITLRLADLHSERARVNSMKELNDGCTVCNAGKEDRAKALKYYQEVLARVPESSIGKVLTQVGHLYQMTGQQSQAIATYERILKEQKAPQVLAEAHLSLAEVHFKARDFAQAKTHFLAVINNPQAGSKGLAAYRVAWCDFNQGELEPAINGLVKILRSNELSSRGADAGIVQVDKQFQEEVSRDLVTFISRRAVTLKDAELVYQLSPEQAKLANVVYLASETERLGQVASAVAMWRFALERQSKPEARLEGHVRLAQLQMEQKLLTDAIRDFDSALAIWPQVGNCQNGQCAEIKARIRKFVLDWNRTEKSKPSEQLLGAYQGYLKTFPNESDMTLWAAKVASDLKQYALAVKLYQDGAAQAKQALVTKPGDKESLERLEGGLLGAIESAELSKEPQLLDGAYNAYLNMSPDKKRLVEVKYQKAHIIYDRGDNAAAAAALREVALLKEGGNPELKKKAADLSLDALVLVKDDSRLEKWAAEYALAFPSEAKDFTAIARKSVLTQSASAAATGAQGLAQAWAVLSRFDLTTASVEEKSAYYKNRLILAEKMGKFAEARDACENMLRQPNLTEDDVRYALSRKAWLAEMALDFDTALAATEKLKGGELQGTQKLLKLAMYAELASKDAKPYYSQFLKDSKDDEKNAAIAAQMVRDSKTPVLEIEKNKATLMKRPALLAELYLEAFGGTQSPEIAKKALSTTAVAQAPAGKVIARSLFISDLGKLREKMVSHVLDGSTQGKMAKTLKARIAMLEESDKFASRAIESGDWTSQLIALDLVAKQNDRFYQELLSLPMPQGLSPEEEQQYLMLLSQQAAPHQTRANDVAKKVTEFWANTGAITQLDTAMDKETGPRRALLLQEIKALGEVAPEATKVQLVAMSTRPEPKKELPTLATLENARQKVRENPMSRTEIEKLLAIEKKMGHAPMVSYLEGRLATLDSKE